MEFKSLDLNSPEHYYLQIAKIIENKITSKEIKIGNKLPSEDELCRDFNVCDYTIRKAMAELTKEGYITRRRNLGTVVISSEPKKELALTTKNVIGLVVCPHLETGSRLGSHEDRRFKIVLEGMEEKTKEKGLYIMYSTMNEPKLALKDKEKDIAGITVIGGIKKEYFNVIKKSGIPFVLLGDIAGDKLTDERVDVIAQDDFRGTYMATKYLIELGHERIVFLRLSSGENSWELEQTRGYIQAMKEAGIRCEDSLQLKTKLSGFENVYAVMKDFLDKSIQFTGLVCPEDFSMAASYAIRERKLKIPADISVVSVGTESALTSVEYDARDIGRLGVERLIEKITNPDWKPMRVIIPNRLVVRDSTRSL
jgi:GntR family transcriptional regulator, arabinose operon transcriptional repressor